MSKSISCPYCNFKLERFFSNGDPEEMAPMLCGDCLQVSLLIEGCLHRMTYDQLESLKKSPAWRDVIEPAMKVIKEEKLKRIPPVDRSQRVMVDGTPVKEDHREINPITGMQKGYVVLSPEERAKGFVRPVRTTYTHKVCGKDTWMNLALAETYARDPKFYDGTFCSTCRVHKPLNEFVWAETDEQLGN